MIHFDADAAWLIQRQGIKRTRAHTHTHTHFLTHLSAPENKGRRFSFDFVDLYLLGLGDVYQIGIRRCLQWNIVMDDDIRGRG